MPTWNYRSRKVKPTRNCKQQQNNKCKKWNVLSCHKGSIFKNGYLFDLNEKLLVIFVVCAYKISTFILLEIFHVANFLSQNLLPNNAAISIQYLGGTKTVL